MNGTILDIQRFSLDDGPGIRTTVFLKGCMMKCLWCHNPESFLLKPQLSYDYTKCTSCGSCFNVCKNNIHSFVNNIHTVDFDKCISCGLCIPDCRQNALKIFGENVESEYVIKEALKDLKYYKSSGGGVTFSGGEATIQIDFLVEMMEKLRENEIHIALETNGCIPRINMDRLIPLVDLWLFDYKATGEELHKKLTNIDNATLLENLEYLYLKNCQVNLRCPMILGINDTDKHFTAIKNLRMKYSNITEIQIMPYHNFGTGKWKQIGLNCEINLENTTDEQIKKWNDIL